MCALVIHPTFAATNHYSRKGTILVKIGKYQLNAATLSLCFALSCSPLIAEELTPPPFQAKDRFDVNVASVQLTTHLNTVAIGGELGLTHSIATHTNRFLPYIGDISLGLNDLYKGKARYEWAAKDIAYKGNTYSQLYFMRVFHGNESQDFEILTSNGQIVSHMSQLQEDNCISANNCELYTYRAARDTRHTLQVSGNFLVWTKPDGTMLKFDRGTGRRPTGTARLREIIYPSGLALTISAERARVHSVTTNSGYQLKYIYEVDSSRETLDPTLPPINTASASTKRWSRYNPKHVVALNRSVEYCDSSVNALCDFDTEWPTATFTWPKGMPRAFYAEDSVFSVKDGLDRITEYHFTPFDTNDVYPFTGKYIEPRLVGIKEAHSPAINRRYAYHNVYRYSNRETGFGLTYSQLIVGEGGRIDKAWGDRGEHEYYEWIVPASQYDGDYRSHGADITVRLLSPLLGAFYTIETLDGTYEFELDIRNRLKSAHPNDGPVERYTYDGRGNIVRITYNPGSQGESFTEAEYPTSCTTSNRKICNKAIWISDARGNKTHYTYHAPSGQVASVTSPPDNNGIKAQTRFEYEQKYALVKNASGTLVQAASPIWLKTQESYCIDSNYANGSCAANDEVVTRYEYQHNNLLLTGMTVTADRKTLRTCYQYDIYGNRIGETQPKANLSSCDQ